MKLKWLWISLAVLTVGAVVTVPVVMTLINQTKPELKKPSDVVPPINDSSIIQTKEIKFDTATNTILGWSDEINKNGNKPIHLELPNEVGGFAVKAIGESAFEESKLESVKLPDGLVDLGERSFWKNALTEISFPPSLGKIGGQSFGTNALTEISFPPSLEEIGEYVFSYNNIQKLIIPGRMKVIGNCAFQFNPNLTELIIEDGVEEIGYETFRGSPILHLDLGNTVKRIGHAAFELHNLNELTIPDSVEYIGAAAFKSYPTKPGISKLNLSSTTNLIIDDYAFAYNKLKEFHVTSNLTINKYGFAGNGLEKISFDSSLAKTLTDNEGYYIYSPDKIGYRAFQTHKIPDDQLVLKANFVMPHGWFHSSATWDELFGLSLNDYFKYIVCRSEEVCTPF